MEKSRVKNFILLIVGFVLVTYLLFVNPISYSFQGSLIEPPIKAYDFELYDHGGNQFRLVDQRGKMVLIFFGYTNCPDVCPTTLADFTRIKENLGDMAKQVTFVFITIDPERDTPERISRYVNAFDEEFLGLSGTVEELELIWDEYFVYQEKIKSDSELDYLMDHTARIYLVDQEGMLRGTFPFGLSPDAMYQDILFLLENN